MTDVVENSLFESAHEAIVFAFHRSSNTVASPLMNRLAGGTGGTGKGLGGLNGSGQAGLILRRLSELGPMHMAVLRARYGVREYACACCEQPVAHHEWLGAIRTIAESAHSMLAMPSVKPELCRDLVIRYFSSNKRPLEDIGSRHGSSRSTAARAYGEIVLWLRGSRKGKGDQPGPKGLEASVFAQADTALRDAGFIAN